MIPTPIDRQTVDSLIAKAGIQDFAHATIREVKSSTCCEYCLTK